MYGRTNVIEERNYTIDMHTPIGVRHGVMSATLRQDKISGTLDILEHISAFEGTVYSDGSCKISGNIITLTQKIEYIATGKITKEDVRLQLQGNNNTFLILGTTTLKEGEKYE